MPVINARAPDNNPFTPRLPDNTIDADITDIEACGKNRVLQDWLPHTNCALFSQTKNPDTA